MIQEQLIYLLPDCPVEVSYPTLTKCADMDCPLAAD